MNTNTPPVSVTVIPLSTQSYAMQFDASLPSNLPEEPRYVGAFSAEQESAIMNMVRQTLNLDKSNMEKSNPPASSHKDDLNPDN